MNLTKLPPLSTQPTSQKTTKKIDIPVTFKATNRVDCFKESGNQVSFNGNFFLDLIGLGKKETIKPASTETPAKDELLGSERKAARLLKKIEAESQKAPDVASKRACLNQIPRLTAVIKETDNDLLKLACFNTARSLYHSYFQASSKDKTDRILNKTITTEELTAEVLNKRERSEELALAKAFLVKTKPLTKELKSKNPLIPEDIHTKHPEFTHHFINIRISLNKDFALRTLSSSTDKETEANFILNEVLPVSNDTTERRAAYRVLTSLTKKFPAQKAKPFTDYMDANPVRKVKPSHRFTLEDVRRINQRMIEQGRNK